MADVRVREVFDAVADAFGLAPEHPQLLPKLLRAINYAINEVNSRANLATPLSRVSSAQDTVTGLDVRYEHVLVPGVILHAMIGGARYAADPKNPPTIAALREQFYEMIDQMYNDLLMVKQSDEDEDVIGLGAPTS